MMFSFDLWIEHTGLGFTIILNHDWDKGYEETYLGKTYLGFSGSIKLLDHELANWDLDLNNKYPPKIVRWLNGEVTCTGCGKEYHTMSFGYGIGICPDCYKGEQPIIELDSEYWLNRLVSRLTGRK